MNRYLPRLGPLALAVCLASCSTTSSTPAPTSPTPAAAPATGTPTSTTVACTFTLSTTSISATAAGGPSTITVTTQGGCGWTATPSASFVTVSSGGSGTGSGSVVLNVSQDPTTNRTGTVTVAGQTVTVSQTGAGLIVAFEMTDSPSQAGPTGVCRIRGVPGYPISSCPLRDTSRTTLNGNTIANSAWTLKYTYDGQAKTQAQSSGTVRDFAIWEYCGRDPSSASGTVIPLSVTLTITDSNGVQATATSGTGNQPAMSLVTYTCS